MKDFFEYYFIFYFCYLLFYFNRLLSSKNDFCDLKNVNMLRKNIFYILCTIYNKYKIKIKILFLNIINIKTKFINYYFF